MMEWNYLDKPDTGPWYEEPDKVQWMRDGLYCVINRIGLLTLCGYVGVKEGHPLHGANADDVVVLDGAEDLKIDNISPLTLFVRAHSEALEPTVDLVFNVHGGITYAGSGSASRPSAPGGIYFVDDDGHRVEGLWFLGFDCGHFEDYIPSIGAGGIYRDIEYVTKEVNLLADMITDFENRGIKLKEIKHEYQ